MNTQTILSPSLHGVFVASGQAPGHPKRISFQNHCRHQLKDINLNSFQLNTHMIYSLYVLVHVVTFFALCAVRAFLGPSRRYPFQPPLSGATPKFSVHNY